MAGLCEGGNEPPGSLKANSPLYVLNIAHNRIRVLLSPNSYGRHSYSLQTERVQVQSQNLVVSSIVAITAATLSGMLSTSLCRISTGSWPHVSAANMQQYADNNVRRLDLPAQSPDLNPIGHLWDELHRRLRSREMRPSSIVQLSAMLRK
ncbi:hypothetical protein ANN_02482 [Periplaneta americana]|uniref:Tc1-like transposase DDE domain-containing protein n=1 Tax=Periplaneta americana TaxID=6978 RepID=A0ABQ8TWE3_PERAM|nr:hypothetical protein ANN_02482 [Periplaneta americana]